MTESRMPSVKPCASLPGTNYRNSTSFAEIAYMVMLVFIATAGLAAGGYCTIVTLTATSVIKPYFYAPPEFAIPAMLMGILLMGCSAFLARLTLSEVR